MVELYKYYVCTLFDSSVSCSFVLATIAHLSKLVIDLLSNSLGVHFQ